MGGRVTGAPVAPLADHLTQRGGDGRALAGEYLEVIEHAINHHPRSLQTAIGPSEIGIPCDRRIAYKLLGQPERPQPPNWKATIGTGAHSWLEGAFDTDNLRRAGHLDGQERWLIETRVTVGFVPGIGFVTGSCDLYDRITATVIDHKTVGPTQLKSYKANGPSAQYRAQAHLYGKGWVNAGLPVDRVAVAFLPRNGELRDSYFWSEPFDAAIADAALSRLARIKGALDAAGLMVLGALPTADNYCGHCPYFTAGSTDPAHGCPGDPRSDVSTSRPALTLVG